MIFDSSELLNLCEKYSVSPVYDIPSIVHLARDEEYVGERKYLEDVFIEVSEEKRKQWLGRLVSDVRAQFWGAWFEMMLYGWLKPLGELIIETQNSEPDFILKGTSSVAIEARAILSAKEEWLEDKLISKIIVTFRQIRKPFTVRITECVPAQSGLFDKKLFHKRVTQWLDTNANEQIFYEDKYGNNLKLDATLTIGLKSVYGVHWGNLDRDLSILRKALSHKAKQHKALRESHIPYVIAIFLESYSLKPSNVVEAWLGKSVLQVDRIARTTVLTTDSTGIHYGGDEIAHTTVSGTLVFKSKYNESHLRRELESYWIENPFAEDTIKIDPKLFPAIERFLVTERTPTYCTMEWFNS